MELEGERQQRLQATTMPLAAEVKGRRFDS